MSQSNYVTEKSVKFDEIWKDIKKTTKAVLTLDDVERNVWRNSFSDIFSICMTHPEPLGDQLYFKIKELLENHVENILISLKYVDYALADHYQMDLLQCYYRSWSEYRQGIEYLNDLYLHLNYYINKKRILDKAGFVEIRELGLDIWRVHIIESMNKTLVENILDGIQNDRLIESDFNLGNVKIINCIINSFIRRYKSKDNVKYYQDLFETPMIIAFNDYYKTEAAKLIKKCTVSEYMKEVIKIIDDENDRALKILHFSSLSKINNICLERFIKDHLDFIFSKSNNIKSSEKRIYLRHMYILLKSIPDDLIELFFPIFLDYMKKNGEDIKTMKIETTHINFVENIFGAYQKLHKLIAEYEKIFVEDIGVDSTEIVDSTQNWISSAYKKSQKILEHLIDEQKETKEILEKLIDELAEQYLLE